MNDINIRMGYPYVYQHAADCEHIFVFADARLLTKSDTLKRSDYPYILGVHKVNTCRCNICETKISNWIVNGSNRLPHNFAFLCDTCFKSYNFINGKKIGSFKAYSYYDRSALI